MNIPFFNLTRQYKEIYGEIDLTYKKVMTGGEFIMGEQLKLFEKEFASFLDTDFCLGVDNGTSALELALRALEISKGDEVIIPSHSFIATALAITSVGAKPVFVDVNEKSFNLEPSLIKQKINKKTKAIIPVHLYGQIAKMDEITNIAKQNDLYVVEDSAQAHGSSYMNKKAGTWGDIGCFSFYPTKNLGCYGDGGAVVTSNKKIYKKLQMLRNYGQIKKYHHIVKGGNHRLDEIQAAFLRIKLKYLNEWNNKRRLNAKLYNSLLSKNVIIPIEMNFAYHVYYVYVIKAVKRDMLQKYLARNGIQTLIHYPVPIHLQKAYDELGYKKGSLPVTERISNEILSLPMFWGLTEKEIEYISRKINSFYT